MTRLWWEQYPERLAAELQALTDAGIRYEPLHDSISKGIYRLRLWPKVAGEEQQMVVTFPDFYPYFRFDIAAPSLALEHHQQPFSKSLCFIGRETFWWNTSDMVATFLVERLQDVVVAGAPAGGESSPREQQQAEPFSDYYSYEYSMFGIDSSWIIPTGAQGGELAFGVLDVLDLHGRPPSIQAIVLQITDSRGRGIATASPQLKKFTQRAVHAGRWVRSQQPLALENAQQAFEAAKALDFQGATVPWAVYGSNRFQVYGVLFPEETGHRAMGEGWIFVVRTQSVAQPKQKGRRAIAKPLLPSRYYFGRAGYIGLGDSSARIPELSQLREKKAVLVGVGAIGAPIALELARAGIGELHLVDQDFVDPATISRWPLGIPAAGRPKVEAVDRFISLNYPYTKVHCCLWRLGGIRNSGLHEGELLDQVFRDADLIIDATAEFGVQHFLSEVAIQRGMTYISAVATPGAWGGRVMRIRPSITAGCWSCLQHAEEDGTISRAPAKDSDGVQPPGCSDPTFTGNSADLQAVAIQGVRLAFSTLCSGNPDGYPEAAWDVAVLSFRSDAGTLIAPIVQTFELTRHRSCQACAQRVSK